MNQRYRRAAMNPSGAAFLLRHFKLVAILVIVVISDATMCQKQQRQSLRPPLRNKLALPKYNIQSVATSPYVNSLRNKKRSQQNLPSLNSITNANKRELWRKYLLSSSSSLPSSLYSLSKKKGLFNKKSPKLSKKASIGKVNQRKTVKRPSRKFKRPRGIISGTPKPSINRITKKSGPSSSSYSSYRDGKKRYKKNRRRPISKPSFIGQSKSSSLRTQLYSKLPDKTDSDDWRLTESFERPVDRRDSRVKRKVFSILTFLSIILKHNLTILKYL